MKKTDIEIFEEATKEINKAIENKKDKLVLEMLTDENGKRI